MTLDFARLADVHSHVLAGLDDGPTDIAQTVEMLRIAEAQQIATICATPHAHRTNPRQVADAVEQLNQVAADAGIAVTIVPGMEIALAPDTLDRTRAGEHLTLNKSRYLLVELPLRGPWPIGVDLVFSNLYLAGYTPILAHVERYPTVQHDPELIPRLIGAGVITQVNADSLLAQPASRRRKTAERLLRQQAVHLIATDSHSPRQRAPIIQPALQRVAVLTGGSYAQMVAENARRVLGNQNLELPEPLPGREQPRAWHGWIKALRRG